MKVEEFFALMLAEINNSKQAFIDNMNHPSKYQPEKYTKEATFCEWITIFCAWMEFTTDMCNDMYGYEDDEESS